MTDSASMQPRPFKDPFVGSTVDGRFQILSRIGQGATSSVYQAADLLSGSTVAVKTLHTHLVCDENLVSRFEREAQAAKILKHPNIVPVSEYSVSDKGIPYLVMEFIEGVSLQQLLVKEGWLTSSAAIAIFIQICAGLNAAHQKGVVHRDIKPGNIMLVARPNDQYMVKILDFGCAQMAPMLGDTVLKLTQTGEMMGSLLYMSPEQCLDGEVDGRSDCYSLGCVLYEALTGKAPLCARTAFETMNKQLCEMPDSLQHARPDLTFSKAIEKVVFKALAKSPAERFQKITDFMDALIMCSDSSFVSEEVLRQDTLPSRQEAHWPALPGASQALHKASEASSQVPVPYVIGGADWESDFPALQDSFSSLLESDLAQMRAARARKIQLGCNILLALGLVIFGLLSLKAFGPAGLICGICMCLCAPALVFLALGKTNRSIKSLETIRRGDAQIAMLHDGAASKEPSSRSNGFAPFIPGIKKQFEVTVWAAERSKDGSILFEIEVDSRPRQRAIGSPLESRSSFWRDLCSSNENSGSRAEFPINGSILTIDLVDSTYLEIGGHLALLRDNRKATDA